MKPVVLYAVVVIQVLVFQLVSLRLSRSIPSFLVWREHLPADLAARLDDFHRRLGRGRRLLAFLFVAAATVAILAPSLDRGACKLALAMVSLASTAAFALGYARDYTGARRIAAAAPDSGIRLALLERRTLRRYYPPSWEALPLFLTAATVLVTIFGPIPAPAMPGSAGGAGDLHLPWFVPCVQLGTYAFLTWLTFFLAGARGCLTPRARTAGGPAEDTLETEERLRRLELRRLFASKTAAVLLLGIMQMGRLLAAGGNQSAWPGAIQWAVVLLMLAIFASFAWQVARTKPVAGR